MPEYRQEPQQFAAPSESEIKARSRRNVAIAIGLLLFIGLVAASVVLRQPG